MKKTTIIASLAVLGCAAVVATLALGGSPKLNAIFEAKATSKSFTFDAAAGSQFENEPADVQEVDVETGSSSPIKTLFRPKRIKSLAFGEGGRFVEAQPDTDAYGSDPDYHYSFYDLSVGINNLTHFAIDVGVKNDVDEGDTYDIALYGEDNYPVKLWEDDFELDGTGNGKATIEWDKGDGDSTVIGFSVSLCLNKDSADASIYISSLSLTWEC